MRGLTHGTILQPPCPTIHRVQSSINTSEGPAPCDSAPAAASPPPPCWPVCSWFCPEKQWLTWRLLHVICSACWGLTAAPGRVFSLHPHLLGVRMLGHCRLVASGSQLSYSFVVKWHGLPGLLPMGSASHKGWETKNERMMAQFQKPESGPGWRSLGGPVMPRGEWLPHPRGRQRQLFPCASSCHRASALHSQWTGIHFSCVSAWVSGCVHHVSEEWMTRDSRRWVRHSYLREYKSFLDPWMINPAKSDSHPATSCQGTEPTEAPALGISHPCSMRQEANEYCKLPASPFHQGHFRGGWVCGQPFLFLQIGSFWPSSLPTPSCY